MKSRKRRVDIGEVIFIVVEIITIILAAIAIVLTVYSREMDKSQFEELEVIEVSPPVVSENIPYVKSDLISAQVIAIDPPAAEPEIEYISLGEFRITAYCACKKCCGKWAENRPLDANGNPIVYGSTGKVLTAGYSIAVDPDVIPYGTKVYIDGREYIAHDTGGAIDENRIDLYMGSHEDALEWGVQYREVFVVKEANK